MRALGVWSACLGFYLAYLSLVAIALKPDQGHRVSRSKRKDDAAMESFFRVFSSNLRDFSASHRLALAGFRSAE